jgi:hypothetical protein
VGKVPVGLGLMLAVVIGGAASATTDSDGDGLTDAYEASIGTDPHERDTDGDFFDDGIDNCPITHNHGQADVDGDGIGKRCDLSEGGIGVFVSDLPCHTRSTLDIVWRSTLSLVPPIVQEGNGLVIKTPVLHPIKNEWAGVYFEKANNAVEFVEQFAPEPCDEVPTVDLPCLDRLKDETHTARWACVHWESD